MENLVFLAISDIFSPLYSLFGWLTRVLFEFFGNYGIAIIFLTIIIRGALIPLNVRSQKSMIKMQALSTKTAELQRKYGDDKTRYQEELMKLNRENGAGGFAGCLLPFLQLIFIFPIYRIVSGPLRYISGVSVENLKAMIKLAGDYGSVAKTMSEINHISLMELLQTNSEFLGKCINKGYITMSQMINLDFLGIDLTKTPQWNPIKWAEDPKTYIPLLIFPILVVVTNIVSIQLTTKLRPDHKEKKEAKEREKTNPARAGQTPQDQGETTMKMMNWFMPIMMLFTTFMMPAAMGMYWVIGGIMGIITQVIVYFMFTKPYQDMKAELEIKKKNAFKKIKDEDKSDDNDKKIRNSKKKK